MDFKKITIATIASHSALQILKGAKDEGFKTLCFALSENSDFYKNYPFIDLIKILDNYRALPAAESDFADKNTVMVPHGSFVAYLGVDYDQKTGFSYFGNKKILEVEADRKLQDKWLKSAGILTPEIFMSADNVDRPVIIKTFGAAGGQGYRFCNDRTCLKNTLKDIGNNKYIIQEYIIGTPVYVQFFYSQLSSRLEIIGCDRRYESNVDGVGRIPYEFQKKLKINPSFTVIGNFPIVLRESLLPKIYAMGASLISKSLQLIPPNGLFGPFCLETVIDGTQKVYAIEISCRIVAGTNLYINGSPYTDLMYDKPVSMGRRIAMEIKEAALQNRLTEILT